MTLRIMLVGLVASLGFEPPSGSDVSGWAQAGTAWVQSRMVGQSGPEVEAKLDLAGLSDCQQVDKPCEVPSLACGEGAASDAAFLAVSEGMVADLSADLLASHREETPGEPAGLSLASEEPAPVGLPEGEEVGCLVFPAEEARAAEVASTEEDKSLDQAELAGGSLERLDRVSSAVRLTREAVQAWAAVMQQTDEECQPSR